MASERKSGCTKRERDDLLCGGALIAISCLRGEDTYIEEIVSTMGPAAMLRVAKKNDDMVLPDVRKAVRDIRSRERFQRGRAHV